MKNIITIEEAINKSRRLRSNNKTIVLVGGCFDVIHLGHVEFLKKAKEKADYLFVLLENDEKIKKIKGPNRPINTQEDRAKVLSAIRFVDIIIMLPPFWTNEQYDDIIEQLCPTLIATTSGDPYRAHKERQAKKTGSILVDVIEQVDNKSTSAIAKLLEKDL